MEIPKKGFSFVQATLLAESPASRHLTADLKSSRFTGAARRPVHRAQFPAWRARGSLRPVGTAVRATRPGPGARQMVPRAGLGGGAEEAGGGEGYGRSEEGSSHRSCWPEAAADLALNEELKAQSTPSASGKEGSGFLLAAPK